ncbi:unnamed protein product [Mytilus edulis]|uniref:Uncharacterized protein n=1 Tax=Mytilus edulis TaxID=6550 RepID=A0A8S3QL47_MYTED|nr:unnamed protein product [Mytilus edulis]
MYITFFNPVVACKIGFISQQGGMCYPCPNPTYGYRCAEVGVNALEVKENRQTRPTVTTEGVALTSRAVITSPRKEEGLADEDVDLEISQNISTEKGTGHEYEEIDERKMSDFFIISSLEQGDLSDNDNSSESSDGIRLPNDGYLNPYTPLQSSLQQIDNHNKSDEYNYPLQKTGHMQTFINLSTLIGRIKKVIF